MFMWRRRFTWPDISAPCSVNDHGCEKFLTESREVRSETSANPLFQAR